MTKPKDKGPQLSAAFQDKSSKEKEKIRKKLAQQMKADIERMLVEDIHSDLQFKLKGGYCVGHRLILKARARCLWDRLCEGQNGDEINMFYLNQLDKSVFDAYIFQVYGSDNADVAAEELMLAMETRGETTQSDEEAASMYVSSEKTNDEDRFALPSPTGLVERQNGEFPNPDRAGLVERQNGEFPNPDRDRISRNLDDSFAHYDLDMISSAQFAAGQDYVSADPSSLFVLPNGQEINNNDANNNGMDANELVPDQNLVGAPEPRIVNLQPQILDLVSHAPVNNTAVPVSLLADIQTQERLGAVGGLDAHSTLPDVIQTSYYTALPHETCSQLGDDLLRAFLQEVDTDCVIAVRDQEFKCHRGILACRSNYFTAMFRGGWIESEGEKIILECVSPEAVEQALLYIYGGVVELKDSCHIPELLMLSDMYGLCGLKDVISLHLRMAYCHFFHKPCGVCTEGVVETLTLAEQFSLVELADRCCKWINKNFVKVWPTKIFSQLAEATMKRCCHSAIEELHADTVLDIIMDCDKLSTSLPRLKWTEPVLDLNTQLMDSAMEFTSRNFCNVLASERFIALGKNQAWSMSLLDTIFSSVIKSLPIEQICKTYLAVEYLVAYTNDKTCTWNEDFQEFLKSLLEKCKGYIKVYIQQVVHCQDWVCLSSDVQKELLQSASYVCFDAHRGRALPKLSSMTNKPAKGVLPKTRTPPKCPSALRKQSSGNQSSNGKWTSQTQSTSQIKESRSSSAGVRSGMTSNKGRKPSTQSHLPRPLSHSLASSRQKVRAVESCQPSSQRGSSDEAVPVPETGMIPKDVMVPEALTVVETSTVPGVAVTYESAVVPEAGTMAESDTPAVYSISDCHGGRDFQKCDMPSSSTVHKKHREDVRCQSLLPLRQRSGSMGDLPVTKLGVSRSRSEELHLLRKGENYVFELIPILEASFSLPKNTSGDSF